MFFFRSKKKQAIKTERDTHSEEIEKAQMEFFQAFETGDKVECIKRLGVLEDLKAPRIELNQGLAYALVKDFEKLEACLSKIKDDSPDYKVALTGLANLYRNSGDYFRLCKVLSDPQLTWSPLKKMHYRINCLQNANSSAVASLINEASAYEIEEVPPGLFYSGEEAEDFFGICQAFAVSLFVAGLCLNECATFQLVRGKAFSDFEENQDTMLFIHEYQRWCAILSLSKYVTCIRLPEGIGDLSEFVWKTLPWPEKLENFYDRGFHEEIMRTIYSLTQPEIHPNIEPYRGIECALEFCFGIDPSSISQLVNRYFDIIAEAYHAGSQTANKHLRYVYAEAIATGNDPYNLRKRIDELRKCSITEEDKKLASKIQLTRRMTRRGSEALRYAKSMYKKEAEGKPGTNDFGWLALLFFRIIEIEYNEKLIIPLSTKIDKGRVEELIEKLPEVTDDEKKEKERWKRDFGLLRTISEGEKPSIELGTIRVLLVHVTSEKAKETECTKYLISIIESILTDEGRKNLYGLMQTVICKTNVDKYRNAPAHTGYMSFSEAVEAKEYVERWLPTIESWFVS